jgi:FlaA1/EpsC-like NDP-sugar epimerase
MYYHLLVQSYSQTVVCLQWYISAQSVFITLRIFLVKSCTSYSLLAAANTVARQYFRRVLLLLVVLVLVLLLLLKTVGRIMRKLYVANHDENFQRLF